MLDVKSIINANNETFYNFSNDRKIPIAARIAATAFFALAFATILPSNLENFLANVITVQAILIGFSFSVMFFLISGQKNDDENIPDEPIEDELKRKRLTKLSKEIFHNISYFNMLAMTCLVLSLLLLIPALDKEIADTIYKFALSIRPEIPKAFEVVGSAIQLATKFAFLFTLIESAYTFARAVGRVNYLFDQKIK